jgi:hypothetical protein
MSLIMMVSTKGEATVVSAATVSCIRKDYILMLIVTYPVAATVGLAQIFCLAAEPAPGFRYFLCGFGFILVSQFLLFIRIIGKSPLTLFTKEGFTSSLWQREGRRDFIKNVITMSL